MASAFYDPPNAITHKVGGPYPVGPGSLQAKSEVTLPPPETRDSRVSSVVVSEVLINRGYPGVKITPNHRDPSQPTAVIVPGAHQTPSSYLSLAINLAALGIGSFICGVPHHQRSPSVRQANEQEFVQIVRDYVALAKQDSSPVILVTHSLGDAVARAYLANLVGSSDIIVGKDLAPHSGNR